MDQESSLTVNSRSNSLSSIQQSDDVPNRIRPKTRRKYSADALYNIKLNPMSQERPPCLDSQFCDEYGVWDPHKWHAAFSTSEANQPEAVKSGSDSTEKLNPSSYTDPSSNKSSRNYEDNRISKLQNEESLEIVLSPQRRSFGGGCKVNEGSNPKTDRFDVPVITKRQQPIQTTNQSRRHFNATNSNAPTRPKTNRSSWTNDSSDRNPLDRFNNLNHLDSKNNSFSRFNKTQMPEKPTPPSSSEHPQHSTRKFESRKFKSEREHDFATARIPTRNLSEGSDDFQNQMTFANSPTASDVDESMWLDVDPGADFQFQNDLESMKVDYNNKIDDLNAEQLQNDLDVLERAKQASIQLPQPEQKLEPPPDDAVFDLNAFLENSNGKMFANVNSESRLQKLFKSNDQNKQLDAEFDRYLQSFEFDSETNDLRRYIHQVEPPAAQQEWNTLNNGMNLNNRPNYVPPNNPPAAPKSRFAHLFGADVNQNNLSNGSVPISRIEKNNALRVQTGGEKVQVLSVADLESDLSPVPQAEQRPQGQRNQGRGVPRGAVISANELEEGLLNLTSSDNDLSAFTSLLSKLGSKPAEKESDRTKNSRHINSPGPDLIQDDRQAPEAMYGRSQVPNNLNQVMRNKERSQQDPPFPQTPAHSTSRSENPRSMTIPPANLPQQKPQPALNSNQLTNPNVNLLAQQLYQNSLNKENAMIPGGPNVHNLPPNLLMFQQQIALQQLKQQQMKAAAANANQLNSSNQAGIKRQAGPSDIFTPTAVMRNLSIEAPGTSTNLVQNPAQSMSSAATNPLSLGNFANQPSTLFSGNPFQTSGNPFQTNPLMFPTSLVNTSNANFKSVGGTTTQALRSAQISSTVGNTGDAGQDGSALKPNSSMGSLGPVGAKTSPGLNIAIPGTSAQVNVSAGTSVNNMAPIVGNPLLNPFLLNPMVRAAAGGQPALVLPTPQNSMAQHLQNLMLRQQLNNILLLNRTQLLRQQLNANQMNPAMHMAPSSMGNMTVNNNNSKQNSASPKLAAGGGISPSAGMFQGNSISAMTESMVAAGGDGLFASSGPTTSLANLRNSPVSMNGLNVNRAVGSPVSPFEGLPGSVMQGRNSRSEDR